VLITLRGTAVADRLRLSVLLLGLGLAGQGLCDTPGTSTQALPDSAEARFEFLDANRDGVLSRYEYDADVAFETADRDHNQLLSASELQDVLGPPVEGVPTVADRLIVADLDSDGELDDAELRRALDMRFGWLDRNSDGNLDMGEMKKGFGVRVRP
jgi:Ca2+-binding EF-hand superfamily protein